MDASYSLGLQPDAQLWLLWLQGASATQLAGPPEGKEIWVEILASRQVWA